MVALRAKRWSEKSLIEGGTGIPLMSEYSDNFCAKRHYKFSNILARSAPQT